jgi:integral membrane protein (TIGR01906 family)
MDKRLGIWALSVISSMLLIVVMLLTSVQINVFNLNFFRAEYQKLNSTAVIGISQEELMQTTEGLLAYIKGERPDLSIQATIKGQQRQVFNEREKKHMVDVRSLYFKAMNFRNIAVVVWLVLLAVLVLLTRKKFRRYWTRGYFGAAVICICLFGLLVFYISRDFEGFWNNFHYVFFSNDLWQLYPATDILIQMVPEQFFNDLVIRILSVFIGSGVVVGILAKILSRKGIKDQANA